MKESQVLTRKLKAVNRQANYELVKTMIKSLRSNEQRFAKDYLMLLHRVAHEVQSMSLYRFMIENPMATEQDARRDYERTGQTNFDKALSTLKKKLGWSLVAEYNTQRQDAYSFKWQTLFEIKSNLTQYHVALSRQLSGYAFDLLNETIEKAKQIEAYRELEEALDLKILHIRARSENPELPRLENELAFYGKCKNALQETMRIYFRLATMSRKQGIPNNQLIEQHKKGLERLSVLYKMSNSLTILQYHLFIEGTIYQLKEEYLAAGKTFQQYYEMTLKTPALNNNTNLGMAASFITDNFLRQQEFELALTYCKKAKLHFEENSYNYFQVEFLEFYGLFYTNKFYLAEKKIKGIIYNPAYRESDFLINTKKYLMACALFAQAKYKETLGVISGLEKIWADTSGWNVGARILTMLCYKMLGDYEAMANERKKFRKVFDRFRKRVTIRTRDKIILKIIHEFLKSNSDAKDVYERKIKLFEELKEKENEWKVMTHEMIAFDSWFFCMSKRTSYKLYL